MTLKKIVLLCLSFLSISLSISQAQNQISTAPVVVLYLYNSENSLPVMGDEDYLLNYGFEVSYENKNLLGYDIQFSYSYLYSRIDNVLEFRITNEIDPAIYLYTDVLLTLNNLDISVNGNFGNIFSFGYGPSFAIVNRSIIVEKAYFNGEEIVDFKDRLASFNIGLIGLINMNIPFSKSKEYWYFYTGVKIRYLHGFFYDEGIRDLSNYSQNFVTANLAIGIGYNF